MVKQTSGRTVIFVILAFGILFTLVLILTMRNIGVESESFDPPDMALPADGVVGNSGS